MASVAGASFRRAAAATALALVLLASVLLASCGGSGSNGQGNTASADPVTAEDYYLDTVCTVSIYEIEDESGAPVPAAEAEDAANAAIDKAFERCAGLDKMLSRTTETSEVSAINDAGGEWVEVSDETLELIQKGIEYAELSGGDFDITIGSVTALWDFHADPEDAKVPDADALAEAVTHVDYKGIEIDGNKVRLTDPEAKIDLGGIAKGYIGDRMTEVLESEGVTSAVINLGGNVICIGAKDNSAPEGEGDFVIGIEAPYSDRTEIVGKVDAHDMTLVTSGVYERQIEVDGKVYHHILSTKTGYSVDSDLVAVTLVGAKGQSGDLDALSTICLIKGSEEAAELIEGMDGIEAVFILSDGSMDQTSGMEYTPVQ